MIDEAKKQGKPYGLYFEDISSGFAVTQRSSPQAFQVIPLVVWRVYVDGRPDELVRGVSIVGTPLAAMKSIIATGDKSEVFNGECGAESGTIPVSAVAPAMLLSGIETQRQPQGTARPPILPIPARIRKRPQPRGLNEFAEIYKDNEWVPHSKARRAAASFRVGAAFILRASRRDCNDLGRVLSLRSRSERTAHPC